MSEIERSAFVEQQFRTILQNVPTAAQGYGQDGVVLYWNKASERLYGYTAAEAIGRNVLDLIIPKEMRASVELGMRQMLETGVVVPSGELSLMCKDGSRAEVFSSHYLVRAPTGEPELFCIDVDLTEIKLSQERMQASDQQFRTLIAAIPDAIFLKDEKGRWQILNEAAKKMFHMDDFPWEGSTDLEMAIARPAFRSVYESCFLDDEKAWAARKLMVFSELIQDENGSPLEYEVLKSPIFTDDGARKALVVVARNVAERIKSEAELRIAAIAFESQQGMFVTDTEFVILRVNSCFTQITGYSAEEAVGQRPHELLNSGRHDKDFFAEVNRCLTTTDTWQGEIWDRRKNGEIFPEWMALTAVRDTLGELTHYVAAFTDMTERKAAEEQIQHLAFFDALTALPNRRLLMDRLKQAIAACARGQNFAAMLFVDLDHFKFLNDTHGHFCGDQLLSQAAARLIACVTQDTTVARLGGDEFVVMLEDLGKNAAEAASAAETLGEKIRIALRQSYTIGAEPSELTYHSGASIGITLFDGEELSTDGPLKRADLAMYQAKAAGRNLVRFFDPQMQAIVTARSALEAGLREALSEKQLTLHYQAQTSISTITGVEALLRWQHPQRGLVLPGDFIALAEENGLILPIGKWVLHTACTQLAEWSKHPKLGQLYISVNVSLRQFHQENFVAEVLDVLAGTGANPQLLKLELTESVLVTHVEEVIEKMTALKVHGVGFSLDDFGTGYSSLSNLKRLPLDQLKIDQSFVHDILTDPNDAAIAKMIVALADTLSLNVIAEGVETEAQREFLALNGCLAYQGFLCSAPLSAREFEEFFLAV